MRVFIKKLKSNYFSNEYIVNSYEKKSSDVLLWKSEKIVLTKFLNKNDKILEIGCGTGRVAKNLYNSGYTNMTAIDYSKEMINKALESNKDDILNEVGDATSLKYNDSSFNSVLFMFNGIMMPQGNELRLKMFKEAFRVLKDDGIFIFTTHNRDDVEYKDIWLKEKELWDKGNIPFNKVDYGDLFTESYGESFYIFIPSINEIKEILASVGFKLLLNKTRSDIALENDVSKELSKECLFWVSKK